MNRRVLLVAVCAVLGLGVLTALAYFTVHVWVPGPRFPKLEVIEVTANQTLHQVSIKIRNSGTVDVQPYLDVANSTVKPLLPLVKTGEELAYSFRYEGEWTGTLLIALRWEEGGWWWNVLVELPSGTILGRDVNL